MTHSIDLEALRAMKESAGLKNLPTEFTFIMRQAIAGAGPRAYDWSDKPHRLVYDLCDEIERIASIPKPPISGVDRRAVLGGWKLVPVELTEAMLNASIVDPVLPLEKGKFVLSEASIMITESVREEHKRIYRTMLAASPASPAPVEAGGSVVETLSRRNRELEETCETKDAENIRLSRELVLAFNREEDYVNQIEDYKRRSGCLVRG